MSSLRLFKVAICGLDIIKNFSEMHKLHRLVRVMSVLAFARIFQLRVGLRNRFVLKSMCPH